MEPLFRLKEVLEHCTLDSPLHGAARKAARRALERHGRNDQERYVNDNLNFALASLASVANAFNGEQWLDSFVTEGTPDLATYFRDVFPESQLWVDFEARYQPVQNGIKNPFFGEGNRTRQWVTADSDEDLIYKFVYKQTYNRYVGAYRDIGQEPLPEDGEERSYDPFEMEPAIALKFSSLYAYYLIDQICSGNEAKKGYLDSALKAHFEGSSRTDDSGQSLIAVAALVHAVGQPDAKIPQSVARVVRPMDDKRDDALDVEGFKSLVGDGDRVMVYLLVAWLYARTRCPIIPRDAKTYVDSNFPAEAGLVAKRRQVGSEKPPLADWIAHADVVSKGRRKRGVQILGRGLCTVWQLLHLIEVKSGQSDQGEGLAFGVLKENSPIGFNDYVYRGEFERLYPFAVQLRIVPGGLRPARGNKESKDA